MAIAVAAAVVEVRDPAGGSQPPHGSGCRPPPHPPPPQGLGSPPLPFLPFPDPVEGRGVVAVHQRGTRIQRRAARSPPLTTTRAGAASSDDDEEAAAAAPLDSRVFIF